MTSNAAEKRAAREYARRHRVSYRSALIAVRTARSLTTEVFDEYVARLLIEAIEGCGIRHWAHIRSWDGATTATITEVGGDTFVLDAETVGPASHDFLIREPHVRPLDLDSFHADVIIQSALFDCVIYRSQVRRRPQVA
ncbi:hypothetical protein Gbro_3421 [Gordonia bronchialis DSM 43247]|uniref:Uncharacterized protein n=1 Tax=Gordonia bronchialis (strain ATCC 25592 / DSM 43247 / BCRC 13721 / JCM 3198 / KCTC 3076 / NBRC 16047 / NCTC 10667) TaxID=526226 RepID=D0LE26_GORB4|nr:hypothetical protein [Gordonia bronchialis]ACY22618.1 hypothetical protein Gbro_3421 [Gordonia bronchialis DSM 43247]MCC3325400.1 hypothetical protein [Gordonia bronchialis]QGS23908.1 hypothetical protein FOB84_06675 [Gordonia bronchialis]STQ65558.1 Uncharacterised protein [Gordonia bronchialis]